MRPARLLAALSIVLTVGLLSPALVIAATTEELVSVAVVAPYNMSCPPPSATTQVCTKVARVGPRWRMDVRPPTGNVTHLTVLSSIADPVPATGLEGPSRTWMKDMASRTCGSPKAIADFVDAIGDLTRPASQAASIGICALRGRLEADPDNTGRSRYLIDIAVTAAPTPPPTPTPKPEITPAPTPKLTPKPTPKPDPTATPKPEATATAVPTATPEASPPPSMAASPTIAPITPEPAEPTPTPEPAEEPTAAPDPTEATSGGGAGVGGGPGPGRPAFFQSVAGIADVSPEPVALGGSLLLVLLLLLLIAFAAELFNNTVENNYDEIAGWFRKGPFGAVRRLRGRITIDPPGRPGVLLFIALTALISSFVDPAFGLDLRSVAVFLGFLIGLIVVLASFKLPPILARRRRTGELGQLRPLPWALVVAALFVLLSRLANLQPGYLYGIVLGAIFITDASDRDEGRETFYGAVWTLAAAILAWVGLTWLRGLGLPDDGFGATLLSTAFAATLVAGLEAAAFGLMPLRFLPGHAVYRWSRLGWALLFGVSVFAFVHLLIGPTSGYVYELSPDAFAAALGVFAAFGALSIGTWLYFRLRPGPEVAEPVEAI